ncbi:MAG: type II toxin-antitoxin system prevent-host-death family antitoxin [Bacteroidota bacterium]
MANQFVTTDDGKKVAVILPIKEYEKLMEEMEDLEDIRLFDHAKSQGSERVPIDTAFRKLDAKRKKA